MSTKGSPSGTGTDAAREARRQIADHKGAWRNRLVADRHVTNAAKVVGYAISEHVNRVTKVATCGVRRLALILGMRQSQVSTAIHELADTEYLDVEWGVQGGGNNASTFRLIIDLQRPDLFLFDKYELADFVEAERVHSAELSGVHPAELYGVQKKGRRSSKNRPTKFKKTAVEVQPGEQNPGNPCNPGGTPGGGTADEDRQSSPTNSARTATPEQRAGALIDPLAIQQSTAPATSPPAPPSSQPAPLMGAAANGADAAADDQKRRARFDLLKAAYPPDRIGDEAEARRVFHETELEERPAAETREAIFGFLRARGADVPSLADALNAIGYEVANGWIADATGCNGGDR